MPKMPPWMAAVVILGVTLSGCDHSFGSRYKVMVDNVSNGTVEDIAVRAGGYQDEISVLGVESFSSTCCFSGPLPDEVKIKWRDGEGRHSATLPVAGVLDFSVSASLGAVRYAIFNDGHARVEFLYTPKNLLPSLRRGDRYQPDYSKEYEVVFKNPTGDDVRGVEFVADRHVALGGLVNRGEENVTCCLPRPIPATATLRWRGEDGAVNSQEIFPSQNAEDRIRNTVEVVVPR